MEREYPISEEHENAAQKLLEDLSVSREQLLETARKPHRLNEAVENATRGIYDTDYEKIYMLLVKAQKLSASDPVLKGLLSEPITHADKQKHILREMKNGNRWRKHNELAARLAVEVHALLRKSGNRLVGFNGALLLHYLGFIDIPPRTNHKNKDSAVARFWKYVGKVDQSKL